MWWREEYSFFYFCWLHLKTSFQYVMICSSGLNWNICSNEFLNYKNNRLWLTFNNKTKRSSNPNLRQLTQNKFFFKGCWLNIFQVAEIIGLEMLTNFSLNWNCFFEVNFCKKCISLSLFLHFVALIQLSFWWNRIFLQHHKEFLKSYWHWPVIFRLVLGWHPLIEFLHQLLFPVRPRIWRFLELIHTDPWLLVWMVMFLQLEPVNSNYRWTNFFVLIYKLF